MMKSLVIAAALMAQLRGCELCRVEFDFNTPDHCDCQGLVEANERNCHPDPSESKYVQCMTRCPRACPGCNVDEDPLVELDPVQAAQLDEPSGLVRYGWTYRAVGAEPLLVDDGLWRLWFTAERDGDQARGFVVVAVADDGGLEVLSTPRFTDESPMVVLRWVASNLGSGWSKGGAYTAEPGSVPRRLD